MVTTVLGTAPAFPAVRRFRLRDGRFFDDEDERAARARGRARRARRGELFPGGDAVGQEIRLRGVPFEVIGVLEAKGVRGRRLRRGRPGRHPHPHRAAPRASTRPGSRTSSSASPSRGRMDGGGGRDRGVCCASVIAWPARWREPTTSRSRTRRGSSACRRRRRTSSPCLATGLAAAGAARRRDGHPGADAALGAGSAPARSACAWRSARGRATSWSQFLVEAPLLAARGLAGGVAAGGARRRRALALGTDWKVALPAEAAPRLARHGGRRPASASARLPGAHGASLLPPIEALAHRMTGHDRGTHETSAESRPAPATRACSLIDDDETLSALLTEYLGPLRLRRERRRPSRRGRCARCKADPPDIVVLDVMLPGMDGFAVCRKIRETSRVPIVMLTARGDVMDRIVGPRAGRRRLPAEALRAARAGGPHPGGAAPRRRRRAPRRALRVGALEVSWATRSARLDGRPLDADHRRVRAARACWCATAAASSAATASWTRRAASTGRPTTARSTCWSAGCARSWATTPAGRPSSGPCAGSGYRFIGGGDA